MSLNGASTDVGTPPAGVGSTQSSFGDFTTLLADINPTYQTPPASGAYPSTWTEESFTTSGLSGPTTGRIGFLYLLTNNANQGSQIGIDSFSLTPVPEPSEITLLSLGCFGLAIFGSVKLRPCRRVATTA